MTQIVRNQVTAPGVLGSLFTQQEVFTMVLRTLYKLPADSLKQVTARQPERV